MQKVKVLLWKVYILRKRHFLLTFLELLVPLIIFWIVVHFKNMMPEKQEIEVDREPQLYSNISKVGNYKIAFTPSNHLTKMLMQMMTQKLFNSGCNVISLESKRNEDEVVRWLKAEYANDTRNHTRDYFFWVTTPKGVGIVFEDTASINNLTYTIRTTRGGIDTSDDSLYGQQNGYGISRYQFSGFLTVQRAIDQAYMEITQNIQLSNRTRVKSLPYVKSVAVDLVQLMMPTIVSLGFTFVMPSLLKEVVEERTSGIKEMMKIMGLRPWLNWLSWMVYSLLVYIPVTLAITTLLTVDSGTGPPIDTKFLYVWAMFLIFSISFLTLILALSTFFTNGTIAMVAGELIWYGVTVLLDMFIVRSPDKYSLFVQLLTCLWPSIALVWAFKTIHNFHRSGHQWTVSNLFQDGAGGGRISVGLAVTMLLVDIVVYSLITWYVDSVKPGPYGRAKPLWFVFKKFRRKTLTSDTVILPKESHKSFEPVPKNLNVGIRIENLCKTYNKGSIVAVNNVNIDIYKGNITALLGHNGAGKTTLMSMLAGFFSPSRGQVVVKGWNIFDHMDLFRSSLGLCPQHNLLFSYFSPIQHLIFFGMLKGMTMKQAKEKGKTLLRSLNMYDRRNYTIAKLSGGMKRKVSLAIALLGDPEVVLLDEPTSGMDPESRRLVWDILLKLRGQRTIIFTTHFMEEADVLGDRIAIMRHGEVSCYGTPIFLKRLYGTGYQLQVVKKDSAPVLPICRLVESFTTKATMKLTSSSQLKFNIKASDSPNFPALFTALESVRDNLGITTISIDCTTMEDVFLRVIEDDIGENKRLSHSIETIDSKPIKLRGRQLMLQQIKALVYKRILITLKSWISTLVFIVVPVILMALGVMLMMHEDSPVVPNKLEITLANFPRVAVAMLSDNQNMSAVVGKMVEERKALYEVIPGSEDLDDYMIDQLKVEEGLIRYERSMMAAFKYLQGSFVGHYSPYFDHSFALVSNMMANILLRVNNSTASITLYCHPIYVDDVEDECDRAMSAIGHVSSFPLRVILVSLALLVMTMTLIPHLVRERVFNFKQLQLMTGVSPMQFWLVNFLWDFALYLVTTCLMIGIIFVFDQHQIFATSGYVSTVALILVLFGCSGIVFAYFFSFFVKSPVKATVSFVVINLAVGLFGATLMAILDKTYTCFGVWRFLLSLNPLFSATSALIHLFTVMYVDGTCLQCGYNCNTTDPFHFLEPGQPSQNPHGINSFLIFLAVDFFIYLGLLLLIEYGILKKVKFIISSIWIKHGEYNFEDDEDVLTEKDRVLSYHKLRDWPLHNAATLQVYDLGKKYNQQTTAVHGVSFQVGRGECFGLLGVNGAGKTTTFKMLTGEEIPDKGDVSVLHMSLRENRSEFLSHIGYCPQFDPISPTLTGREMLRIFALLRGVPSDQCNAEIFKWTQKLGFSDYVDRRCGTYSGGNKRKLSTAVALVGAPAVVLLDEPTAGVDPVSRRGLWGVVAAGQRAGQAVVLTSHSMEECEVLCTRLTIMVGGRMQCIGSPQYIKQKFGQGYTIKVKLNLSIDQKNFLYMLKTDIAINFRTCTLKDEHLGLLHYHLPDCSQPLAEVFQKMEQLKKIHVIIEDYIVSNTTLEDVFMSFAHENVKEL